MLSSMYKVWKEKGTESNMAAVLMYHTVHTLKVYLVCSHTEMLKELFIYMMTEFGKVF